MKLSSVYVDHDKKANVNVEELAEKGRRRQAAIEEERRMKQLEFIRSLQEDPSIKSPLGNKKAKFENSFKKRLYPERYVYVIMYDQDLKNST